jgi:hypothetical protein
MRRLEKRMSALPLFVPNRTSPCIVARRVVCE